MNHPKPTVLRNFLRSLTVADAGLVLHLLECPRCGRQGWSLLTPRPVRRRVGEPRLADPVEPEGYEAVLERLGEQAEDTVTRRARITVEGRIRATLLPRGEAITRGTARERTPRSARPAAAGTWGAPARCTSRTSSPSPR